VAVFQMNMGKLVPSADFLPRATFSGSEWFQISCTGFYGPAVLPIIEPRVTALEETQSTDPIQLTGLILSSSITRLTMEVTARYCFGKTPTQWTGMSKSANVE